MRKSVILGFTLVIALSFSMMIGMPVMAIATPPTATTGAAGSITFSGATLNGTVNANNASTTVSFDYGTDTSYGTNVAAAPPTVGAGAGATAVSVAITGLNPALLITFVSMQLTLAGRLMAAMRLLPRLPRPPPRKRPTASLSAGPPCTGVLTLRVSLSPR